MGRLAGEGRAGGAAPAVSGRGCTPPSPPRFQMPFIPSKLSPSPPPTPQAHQGALLFRPRRPKPVRHRAGRAGGGAVVPARRWAGGLEGRGRGGRRRCVSWVECGGYHARQRLCRGPPLSSTFPAAPSPYPPVSPVPKPTTRHHRASPRERSHAPSPRTPLARPPRAPSAGFPCPHDLRTPSLHTHELGPRQPLGRAQERVAKAQDEGGQRCGQRGQRQRVLSVGKGVVGFSGRQTSGGGGAAARGQRREAGGRHSLGVRPCLLHAICSLAHPFAPHRPPQPTPIRLPLARTRSSKPLTSW